MERISAKLTGVFLTVCLLFSGCGTSLPQSGQNSQPFPETAETWESPEELYRKALSEDILIVYTVTSRAALTKDAFEKEYPGLDVEIRDLRSPNLIEAVEENHKKGLRDCDVVLCTDSSGDFLDRLVKPGLVVPYLPPDIRVHMKEGTENGMVSFLNEAELLFYNPEKYKTCPVSNLWELTKEHYRGKIYMPNPLRSFSTYALCTAVFEQEKALTEAYQSCFGTPLSVPSGESAASMFWTMLSKNAIFTNSSDEVAEALNDGIADFGICVSSKLRFREIGYKMEPVQKLLPFCGCRTSYSVMLSSDALSPNAAKLFIRFLLGEADGKGEGIRPFCTPGTWSVRDDVDDGNTIPREDFDLIEPDQNYLIETKEEMERFWSDLLKQESGTQT